MSSGNVVEWQGRKYVRKIRSYTGKVTRDATASKQFTVTINTDPNQGLPFLLSSLHLADTADGKALTSQEQLLVQIRDNQQAYQWGDLAPREALFGDRITGGILPTEIPVAGNTQISVTVQNAAVGMTAGDCYITFKGCHLVPLTQ